jgi:antitoxin (DNA-binding transcriptional repressor) of toxin-antitoxin stability system
MEKPIAQVSPMITYVTLPEATANIVQLLVGEASRNGNRVSQGEEIIISQAGQPIAHISPAQRDRSPRVPGQYAGKLIIPDDFNDPLPDDAPRTAHAIYPILSNGQPICESTDRFVSCSSSRQSCQSS